MPSTRRTFNELIGIRLNSEAPLQVMVMMDAGNHAGLYLVISSASIKMSLI
jgi:hypothetical protein